MDARSAVCAAARLPVARESLSVEEGRAPRRDSSRAGDDLREEATRTRGERRLLDFTRTTKPAFSPFARLLLDEGGLTPSAAREAKASAGEKTTTSTQASRGLSARVVAKTLRRSASIASTAAKVVSKSTLGVEGGPRSPPVEGEATREGVGSDERLSPRLDDRVGAIDGARLPASPGEVERGESLKAPWPRVASTQLLGAASTAGRGRRATGRRSPTPWLKGLRRRLASSAWATLGSLFDDGGSLPTGGRDVVLGSGRPGETGLEARRSRLASDALRLATRRREPLGL